MLDAPGDTMHIHRAPHILAILSCFTTLTIMEVTLTAAENDHASSKVRDRKSTRLNSSH